MNFTYALANQLLVSSEQSLSDEFLDSLERSLFLAQEQLQQFAGSDNFDEQIALIYGDSANASAFQLSWLNQDFNVLSKVEIRTSEELNGADGAYGGSTDTIYLSYSLLSSGDIERIASVLLEEAGHRIDRSINARDRAGDEGAIFSALVSGQTLEDSQLAALQTEDDTATIHLDDRQIVVENSHGADDGLPVFIEDVEGIGTNNSLANAVVISRNPPHFGRYHDDRGDLFTGLDRFRRSEIRGRLGRADGRAEVDVYRITLFFGEGLHLDVDYGHRKRVHQVGEDPDEKLDTQLYLFRENQLLITPDPDNTDPGNANRYVPGSRYSLSAQDGSADAGSARGQDPTLSTHILQTGTYHIAIATEDAFWHSGANEFRDRGRVDRGFHGDYLLHLVVLQRNVSPIATNDFFVTNEDTAFTTGNVLVNDYDPDGDSFRISFLDLSQIQGFVGDNNNGTFYYDPQGKFNYLGAEETARETFTYGITDDNGVRSNATVTIQIRGVNDAPVITSGDTTGTVKEIADLASGENTANLTDFGQLNFTDVDLRDIHNLSITPQNTGYLGNFFASIGDPATGDGNGAIDWNFTVNDALLESLKESETVTQVYDIRVADNHGGFDTETVTITLAGTNDDSISVDMMVDADGDGRFADSENGIAGDLATFKVTISNTGDGPVTLNQINVTGADLSHLIGTTLPVGASITETYQLALPAEDDEDIIGTGANDVLDGLQSVETYEVMVNASGASGNVLAASDRATVQVDFRDTIAGGLGNDRIFGHGADDILRGDLNNRDPQRYLNGGDDTIFGGAGDDRIGGKSGNDRLFGDEGDDQIWGDDGDDLLRGGLGDDTLTGDDFSSGRGSDTFVLAIGEGTDTIVDFEVGVDFIGLADQLSFGQLDLVQDGGNTRLDLRGSGTTLAILNDVNADALRAIQARTFVPV